MILLDTNAVLWLETGHRRARRLEKAGVSLAVSPASLLELQFLHELGRIRLKVPSSFRLAEGAAWVVDEPPVLDWFERANAASWTHDPFDRLIVAHARARGWRLATGDGHVLEHLEAREVVEL